MSREVEAAKLTYRVRLSEQAEMYDDMASLVEELVECKKVLTQEELRLVGTAFKNLVAPGRRGYRFAEAAISKYNARGESAKAEAAGNYRSQLAKEIERICSRVDALLKVLSPATLDPGCRAFLAKMGADFERYRAELSPASTNTAQTAYSAAVAAAEALDPGNAVRLGIALNYAVFTEELLGDKAAACRLATTALEDAERSGGAEKTPEGLLVERLLRDNVDLWTSEIHTSRPTAAAM